jgi:hypothetical protein
MVVVLVAILSVLTMLLGSAVGYRINQIINERKERGNE